ncbi:MAG: hypothetical protein WC735_04675 [Candidatus Paceibacterota bacterium]|jgi:hypothetical protein
MVPSRNKNKESLTDEWANLKKDWFSVYNWARLSRKGYSEKIAKLLLDEFEGVKISYAGLRKNYFRLDSHHGQCQLSTDISQHVEKRFCRALFNLKELPLLGKVLDYEVPFKEKSESKHGDIDLLSYKDGKLFIIEAKKIGSSESILKAILEAYVYSKLVYAAKEAFYADFKIDSGVIIKPAVLTFINSTSGQQLLEMSQYPNIKALIDKINADLVKSEIEKIGFFLITNPDEDIKFSLEARPFNDKCKMIVFKNGFKFDLKEIKL